MSRYLVTALVILFAIGPSIAGAESFELTPFFGYRVGGDLDNADGLNSKIADDWSYGLTLEIPLHTATYIELLWSHQETTLAADAFGSPDLFDLDVDYYQIGGHWEWRSDVVRPFIAVTGGATKLAPQGIARSSKTLPSFSLGGGSKFMVAEHFGFRLEGRIYGTYNDGSGRMFCNADDCLLRVTDNFIWQLEGMAGLVFKF